MVGWKKGEFLSSKSIHWNFQFDSISTFLKQSTQQYVLIGLLALRIFSEPSR